jgi:hypothetical protein
MSDERSLNEIVLLELPAQASAVELLDLLSSSRLAWLERGDEVSVVGVLLNPDEHDLASLLRSVEAWLEQRELLAIRFEVDGRTYVLQPGVAARASAAA